MDAPRDTTGAVTALGRRFPPYVPRPRKASPDPLAELISAMPIVILMRAVRDAFRNRADGEPFFRCRRVDGR